MAPAKQPQTNVPVPIIPGAPAIPIPIPNLPGPAHAITDAAGFIAALTNPHTWVRVAEVGVGIILIAVGVGAMLRVDVQGTVRKGAKAAALL